QRNEDEVIHRCRGELQARQVDDVDIEHNRLPSKPRQAAISPLPRGGGGRPGTTTCAPSALPTYPYDASFAMPRCQSRPRSLPANPRTFCTLVPIFIRLCSVSGGRLCTSSNQPVHNSINSSISRMRLCAYASDSPRGGSSSVSRNSVSVGSTSRLRFSSI